MQLGPATSASVSFENLLEQYQWEGRGSALEATFDLDERYLPYFPSRVHVPDVAFIVARTDNDVIGCENGLPWRMRSDMRRFKELTSYHAVIMGRKTFESIGKPLPNRFNIVVSRDAYLQIEGVATFTNVRDALLFSDILSIVFECERTFVIGGGEIFDQFRTNMSLLFLTQIHDGGSVRGDSFFDYRIDRRSWAELYTSSSKHGEGDQFPSTFSIYRKKRTGTRSRTVEKIRVGLDRNREQLLTVGRKFTADKKLQKDPRQLELRF